MNSRIKHSITLLGVLFTGFLLMYFTSVPNATGRDFVSANPHQGYTAHEKKVARNSSSSLAVEIRVLTDENKVIPYVKQNHRLPTYYIRKSEARKRGWNPSLANLCDVLPGKAIGGDKFRNRERTLPAGREYYEADVNYDCGRRDADRIIFTTDGDVWITHNHYKSFEKK